MNNHSPAPRTPAVLPAPAALLMVAALFVLAGCGGAGLATPTAIPADIVRPVQSTPALSMAQPEFRLDNSTPEPIFVTQEELSQALTPPPVRDTRSFLRTLLMNQPPTAMGIAPGGVTLLDIPGGSAVASVPPAGTVTITGRSADGAWLAAFTDGAIAGWIPAGSVVLFGDDDLTIVEEAFSPGPVATLIADALIPVASPISAVLTAQALAPPTPAGTPVPAAPLPSGDAAVGTVESTGNLNLRALPSTEATVTASLRPGAQVVVLGQTEAGDWLQVRTPSGDGWVNASFIALPADANLPVTAP